jgi:hypothetical protein
MAPDWGMLRSAARDFGSRYFTRESARYVDAREEVVT